MKKPKEQPKTSAELSAEWYSKSHQQRVEYFTESYKGKTKAELLKHIGEREASFWSMCAERNQLLDLVSHYIGRVARWDNLKDVQAVLERHKRDLEVAQLEAKTACRQLEVLQHIEENQRKALKESQEEVNKLGARVTNAEEHRDELLAACQRRDDALTAINNVLKLARG